MKKIFLSIIMVMAISLSASAMVFPKAMGSGYLVDVILAQSMEQEINQELPSDQGTPQEEMVSGQGMAQDTESTQGICTGPSDCPGQNEATASDNN